MIIKVCGMRDANNLRALEFLPVDWSGFIFCPQSPRYAGAYPAYLPQKQKKVGVFVNADNNTIVSRSQSFHLDFIQLHGQESPLRCTEIKSLTGLPIIKSIAVGPNDNLQSLSYPYRGAVDFLLFDTRSSQPGGSGRQFPHKLLDTYGLDIPFLLARLTHTMLAGFDLNSRFETMPGIKDMNKLLKFTKTIQETKP